ncbi:hypothetical protein SAMN05444161_3892 [Rhizobiales bacterium GAS191]|nr:hypothetical protein SAMN05444161_3892 [Rhizobiales bacterium GAS191]
MAVIPPPEHPMGPTIGVEATQREPVQPTQQQPPKSPQTGPFWDNTPGQVPPILQMPGKANYSLGIG